MKLLIVLSVVLIFLAMPAVTFAQQQEEITLTTYYPAPYGDYTDLSADNITVNKLGIGGAAPPAAASTDSMMVAGNINFASDASGATKYTIMNARTPLATDDDNTVATVGYVKAASSSGPGSWDCSVYTSNWVSFYDTNASVSCPSDRNLITGGCHYDLSVDGKVLSSMPINGANGTGGWFCLKGGNNRQHQAYAWCCK